MLESDLQQKNRKNECMICLNCNNTNKTINDVNNNKLTTPTSNTRNNEIENEFVNCVLIPSSSTSTLNRPSITKRMSSIDSQLNFSTNIENDEPIAETLVPASVPVGSSVKSNSSSQANSQNLNQPFQYLSSNLEPKFLLTIIHERLESHRKEFGNRVKCVPSVRTINCQHHCVALLTTRLFTILCNDSIFQHKLINDNQQNSFCFNIIVELLNPNNDPVSVK